MLVPLYGFVEGDTIGLLVLAHGDMSVSEVAKKLFTAASLRVQRNDAYDLYRDGVCLPPDASVTELGLSALARVDLRFRPVLP
jgi:hypothetical protein